MAEKRGSRFFRVNVSGHRLTKDVWRIDGALTFKEGLEAAVRDDLLGRGRLALVSEVVKEGLRGRSHGATAVEVHMNVDGLVSDFELGTIPARTALPR